MKNPFQRDDVNKRELLLKQFFLFTLLLLTVLSGCRNKPERKEVFFFYMELCPNCDSYKAAAHISSELTVLSTNDTDIIGHSYNLINEEDAAIMMKIIREKNLNDIVGSLPILVIDDTVFTGYESISAEIIELKSLPGNTANCYKF